MASVSRDRRASLIAASASACILAASAAAAMAASAAACAICAAFAALDSSSPIRIASIRSAASSGEP